MDNLKGDTLKAAAHLPLRKLKLMECVIDAPALKIIAGMKDMETLDLIQCYGFKNEDLQILTRLDKLKSFCIERSILTEEGSGADFTYKEPEHPGFDRQSVPEFLLPK
ncbi:MAG: hypothetical protein R3D26_22770 [Cyanobacteriota/Melainabacteria group bacterium]